MYGAMARDWTEISLYMDRAAQGEDEAFARVADWVQDDIYRFALAHGLRGHDAAEATQEVLLRAYQARERWKTGSRVLPWLLGIAMNVVREQRRKSGRQGVALDLDVLMPSQEAGQADQVELGESLGRLATALADLPPRQRETVTCRYIRQMSVAETAEAMGCAQGTVKAAVAAGLARLRLALRESDDDER